MSIFNCVLLDSATTNVGHWVNINALFPHISFNVVGLEAGGGLTVNVSNAAAMPAATGDPSSVTYSSLTGNGSPLFQELTVKPAWIQMVKTPGPTPTETTVRLAGIVV